MNQYIFHTGIVTHEIMHGLFFLPFGIYLYIKTKSVKHTFIALLVTYFLDIDHLVDYFYYNGLRFDLYTFLANRYFENKISFVPLHGWEWLAFVSFFAYKRGWKSIYIAVAMGMLAHLLLDSITVGSFLFYSIIYRLSLIFLI